MFKEDILKLVKKHTYGSKEFSKSWLLGGSYGTCWDEDGPSECWGDAEPEMNGLSDFLRDLDDEMTQETVARIESNTKEDTYSESDYYGGCQNYASKTLTVDSICEALTNSGYGIL